VLHNLLHAVTFRSALIINGLQRYINVIAGCGDGVASACGGLLKELKMRRPLWRPPVWAVAEEKLRKKKIKCLEQNAAALG
jgi:hypothetical protein